MTTGTHISDDVGNPDAVIADCDSFEVTIRPLGPITYLVYAPDTNKPYVTRFGGEPFTFKQRFTPYLRNQAVGYTTIPSGGGTQTFDKVSE